MLDNADVEGLARLFNIESKSDLEKYSRGLEGIDTNRHAMAPDRRTRKRFDPRSQSGFTPR